MDVSTRLTSRAGHHPLAGPGGARAWRGRPRRLPGRGEAGGPGPHPRPPRHGRLRGVPAGKRGVSWDEVRRWTWGGPVSPRAVTAFVGSNVRIRHLTGDPPDQAARATRLLSEVDWLLLPDLIVSETVYVPSGSTRCRDRGSPSWPAPSSPSPASASPTNPPCCGPWRSTRSIGRLRRHLPRRPGRGLRRQRRGLVRQAHRTGPHRPKGRALTGNDPLGAATARLWPVDVRTGLWAGAGQAAGARVTL
jgi:hypothetical protein